MPVKAAQVEVERCDTAAHADLQFSSADERVLCAQPDAWFRYSQFWIAMVGMVTGLTVAVYLLRFAVQGRIWRFSREVSLAHAAVVLIWLFVWAVGALAR